MIVGIYKITSPSKKVYIGQSINIEKRFYNYKMLDCKGQPIIYNSLKKHGWENHIFEIVCQCEVEELNDMERYYQDLYSVVSISGMNCILTKASDRSGKISDETKKKLSISHTGKKVSLETKEKMRIVGLERYLKEGNKFIGIKGVPLSEDQKKKISIGNLGKKHTPEHINKVVQSNKGRVITDEARLNMSEGQKGRLFSEEHRKKISKSLTGLKKTEEHNKKVSLALKGRVQSKERREQNSVSHRGLISSKRISIIQMDINGVEIMEHKSIKHLSEYLGKAGVYSVIMPILGTDIIKYGFLWKRKNAIHGQMQDTNKEIQKSLHNPKPAPKSPAKKK